MSIQPNTDSTNGRSPNSASGPETYGASRFRERAESLAAQGLWTEALAECNAAVEVDVTSAVAVTAQVMMLVCEGGRSAAASQARQVRSIQQSLASSYLLRGSIYSRSRQDERACADFSHVILLAPDHARARAARGEIYRRLGNSEQALADFTAAVNLDPAAPDALCGRGNLRLELGDPAAALNDFTVAVGLDAARADAFLGRGRALSELSELESARQDFDRAIELEPRAAAAYYYRGFCHALLRNFRAALTDLDQALSLDPGNSSAYLARARAHQAIGQSAAALLDFDEYLRRDPDSVAALVDRGRLLREQSDYDRSAADFSEALRRAPSAVEVYLQRGLTLCLKGDREAAAADLTEVLRRFAERPSREIAANPRRAAEPRQPRAAVGVLLSDTRSAAAKANEDDPTAISTERQIGLNHTARNGVSLAQAALLRAAAAREKGGLDAALAEFAEAVRLDPTAAEAYRERGRIYRSQKRPADAVEQFTRAIQLNPLDVDSWLGRGNAHAESGDIDAAIADYTAVLRMTPESSAAWQNRARLFVTKGEFDKAAVDAEEAVRLDPESPRGYFTAGVARAGLEQFAAALSHFEKAAALSPNDPFTHYERGRLRARTGDMRGALADFNRALILRPNFLPARYSRGVVLRETASYADALVDFNEFMRRHPNKCDAYYQRALTFVALGDHQRAVADLDRALEIDPTLTSASALRQKVLRDAEIAASPGPTFSNVLEEQPDEVESERPPSLTPVLRSSDLDDTGVASVAAETTQAMNLKQTPAAVDRRAGNVRLACPGCNRPGKARWNRLDKAFQCEGCGCVSRPDGTGRLIKVLSAKHRTSATSAHQTTRPNLRVSETSFTGRNLGRTVVIGGCLFALAAALLLMIGTGRKSSLETRGADLTRAWLTQDAAKMKELTAPESAQHLEAWLTRNPPPEFIRAGGGGRPDVEVSVQRRNGNASDVAAKIETKSPDGGVSQVVVVYQHWVETGGNWYFAPDRGPKARR